MVEKKIGKPYGGPWYSRFDERIQFEQGVDTQFPGMIARNFRKGKKVWREYQLAIEVPTYNICQVTIKLYPSEKKSPKVTVNGSSDSPHRYENNSLCMWYPWDPKDNRWCFEDGLLLLLVLIQAHLFREAWWRESNEWLGPEKSHKQNITNFE
jgi:hypothetical protein